MDEQAKGNPAKVALIVGLVVVAAAAIYFATTQASKPVESPVVAHPDDTTGVGPQPFYNPDLPNLGVPAPGDPKFNVKVELDTTKGRNQFRFTVTEEHGWAANGVYVTIAHSGLQSKEGRGMDPNRTLEILCNRMWLDFGSELKHTTTVGAAEFLELDDWGTSENWTGTVTSYSDLTAPKPG